MAEWLQGLEHFHFLRPWWLAGIPLMPLLLWRVRQLQQQSGHWAKVIAPALQPFLIRGQQTTSKLHLPFILLGGLIAFIALAGPSWQQIAMPIHKSEQGLVILFDLSPSMQATDIKPDRLTRARLKTIDLLNQHKEGYVGLVAYAGDAHVVSPMTDDANTLISQLPVLTPDIMPEAGSRPEAAIEKGLELMMNAGMLEGDLLLVTDGLTSQARMGIDSLLQGFSDFRLSILGVGTDEGAPIPLDNSGFARDSNGGIVVARLGATELAGLAKRAGGRFTPITGDDRDINYLLAPMKNQASEQSRALERTMDTWQDNGPWLTLLLLPLAIATFRRGLFILLLMAPLLYSPTGQAGIWQDLWATPDQQGYKAMQEGDPARATERFENSQWKGAAAYQNGAYEAAAEAFSQQDSAEAHYNRGNSLAKAGKLEEALDAYNAALSRNADLEDASQNKAIIEELLKQQEQQNQQQQQNNAGEQSDQQQPSDQQEQNQQAGSQDQNQSQDDQGQNQQQHSGNDQQGDQDTQNSHDSSGQQHNADNQSSQNMQNDENQQDSEKPPSEQQHPQPEQSNKSGEQKEQSSGQESDQPTGQQGESQKEDSEPKDSAQAGQAQVTDSSADAEEEAMAQLLRRVPDDPGGLLRRKFEYQSREQYRQQQRRPDAPPDQYSEERW